MKRGEGERLHSLTQEEKQRQQEEAPPNFGTLDKKHVDMALRGIEVETPLPRDIPEGQREQIGGKPGDIHEIRGKPIDPDDAARIQSAEMQSGHGIGKGSLAARAQAAAAFNQRESIVPNKGGGVGIDSHRGVQTGHNVDEVFKQKTHAGDRKYN
jgi:hypothetical protein